MAPLSFGLLGALLTATGVPQNGFPNWQERTLLTLTNRARADPAAVLAGCPSGDCPDAKCYAPSPPLVWDYSLNQSARFHVQNLVASDSMLQHPSPCVLVSDIVSLYPASCDGSPSCACQGGKSLCTCQSCSCDMTQASCVTQPFTRIAMWNQAGCAENIAAGYSDPETTFYGWLFEQCSDWNQSCGLPSQTTCSSQTENGHRFNILDPTSQTMGAGSVVVNSGACYQGEWDGEDFACGTSPTIPTLVAGSHFPQSGSSATFWVNWYDAAAPGAAQLDVDGTCQPMSVDVGSGGNATYTLQTTLGSGCHAYVFEFTDAQGTTWMLPEIGAYQAGTGCSQDYVTTAPASCGGAAGTSGTTSGTTTTGTTGGGTSAGASTGSDSSSAVGTSTTGGAASTTGSATSAGTSTSSTAGSTSGSSGGSSAVSSTSAGTTTTSPGKPAEQRPSSGGCSCASSSVGGEPFSLLLLAVLLMRRRR